MNIPIYVINFNDEDRKTRMIHRFNTIGLNLNFMPPVYISDARLNIANDNIKIDKRTWAIMLQHLDSIKDFYERSTSDYCIICEDDILISKYLHRDLPAVLEKFNKLNLDILLLGYLLSFKLQHENFKIKESIGYTINEFPNDLWGSQMYLISRTYSKYLLDKYTLDFAINNLDQPFSPDWTITKNGNRAILYPMLAVEEGETKTLHSGQNSFHKNCFIMNYDPDVYQ